MCDDRGLDDDRRLATTMEAEQRRDVLLRSAILTAEHHGVRCGDGQMADRKLVQRRRQPLFLALELSSLSNAFLVCWSKGSLKSTEAALKYFLLGAFAAAITGESVPAVPGSQHGV